MARLDDVQEVLESQLLSRLCKDVGFSRRAWERRVLYSDVMNTSDTYRQLFQNDCKTYVQYSGSSSEGVAADFLWSDTDVMSIILGSRVTEREAFPPGHPDHIYQTVRSEHPAFVRLKLLQAGTAVDKGILPTPRYCIVDETGNLVLNGTAMKESTRFLGGGGFGASEMHGPAHTTSLELQSENEYDYVLSLHCGTWPSVSEEWIHRHKPNYWPTPYLIKEVTEQGCELVAVGNPESEGITARIPEFDRRELQWRLSSSLAERILIRSLNIVQIRCYFLLKLVLAYLIKPYVKDGLSSYLMKNVLLHVVENTDPRKWRKDNLTCCFMTCLQTLLRYLELRYVPQYFILTHNLLRPKVQGETYRKILDIVRGLYSEGWRCVLRCFPFTSMDLPCDHHVIRCHCFIRLWEEKAFIATVNEVDIAVKHICLTDTLLHPLTTHDFIDTIQRSLRVINFDESNHRPYFPSPSTAVITKKLLRSHVGYMLLYVISRQSAKKNRRTWAIMRISRSLLEENCDVDMTSCHLKLATFYYQIGLMHKCIQTVQNVLAQYSEEQTLPRCGDDNRLMKYIGHPRLVSTMRRLRPLYGNIPGLLRSVAFPVTFSPWEILSAPPAIQGLVFTRQVSTPEDRFFFKCLYIDPLVYSHFLLGISFVELGDPVRASQSLETMRFIVRDPWRHMLYYPETAHQLLDYCERHYRL